MMVSPPKPLQESQSWKLQQPHSLQFGPNELCTLRQYLSTTTCRIPLDCLVQLFHLACHDWVVYSQFLWRLRDSLLFLQDPNRTIELSKDFIRRLRQAFVSSAPTSIGEYLFRRAQVIKFLYCMSKDLPCLAMECISFLIRPDYFSSHLSPSFPNVTLKLKAKSLIDLCKGENIFEGNQWCSRFPLYSPQELYILFKSLSQVKALDEAHQLQLYLSSVDRISSPRNHTSLFPKERVQRQDRRQWAKIRKKLVSSDGDDGNLISKSS